MPCESGDGSPALSELLTVVLTTSATRGHPSPHVLEETLSSFAHAPELRQCRLVVVCDGCKVREKVKYRSGIMPKDRALAYEEYLGRLDKLASQEGSLLFGAELLFLSDHHGFSLALRHGINRVRTPYVIVVQHDRSFMQPSPVESIVAAMERNSALDLVHLPTSTTAKYADLCLGRYKLRLEPTIDEPANLAFLPLLQFYDSTHIARTAWYTSFIFGVNRRVNLKHNGFIESTLGPVQLADIRARGLSAHAEYGTFVLDCGGSALVGHLDSHDSRLTPTGESPKLRWAERYSAWGEQEAGAAGEAAREGRWSERVTVVGSRFAACRAPGEEPGGDVAGSRAGRMLPRWLAERDRLPTEGKEDEERTGEDKKEDEERTGEDNKDEERTGADEHERATDGSTEPP